jgi:seryl-tRNA synthetase
MNAIEKRIEELKAELKVFQEQYLTVSKQKQVLKENIKSKLYQIKVIENSQKIVPVDLLERDINICIDFIRKNKSVTSKQIVDHLNLTLMDQEVRWSRTLNTVDFSGRMGNYLKNRGEIIFDPKGVGEKGRRTTIWEIR